MLGVDFMNHGRRLLAALAVFTLVSCQDDGAEVVYPARPIKVVVPFAAGGGSDTFARIVKRTIDERQMLPEPLVIVNVPGAGATIGSRRVKNAPPDGYTILNVHEALTTAKHSGKVAYGPEAFEPIAGTGEAGMVIAVADGAPYQDLRQLLGKAAEEPDSVVFSANLGAPSHFVGLMLEKASPGARFRYTQTGGGAKRFAALIGGHIDVSAFNIAEYVQFRPGGLRAVAFLGAERHPAAPEAPTALEQGVEIEFSNIHVWWAPKGAPPERLALIAATLRQAMEAPETRQALARIQTDPVFLEGAELRSAIAERERSIATVSQRPNADLPDYPLWALAAVVVCGLAVRWRGARLRSGRTGLAALAVGLCVGYVVLLRLGWPGFALSTAGFVFGAGWAIGGRGVSKVALATAAVLMSVGLEYLFRNVFVIDLP